MDGSKLKIEFFIRLFIILTVVVESVRNYDNISMGRYIIFLLIFILNSQIRFNFLKNKLVIVSLFLELGLIYYMDSRFGGIAYLLLFVTMLDSFLFLQGEGYIAIAVIFGMLCYFVRLKSIEVILITLTVYMVVFVFAVQIKKLRKKVMEVEVLYDENRKYSYQLEDAKKRLEEYMKKVERVSQLEERNRISREIHDTLGHKLTGVIMQLDAAIRVSEVDMEKGKSLMGSVRENMNTCVEILRETVRSVNPKDYTNRILSIQQMIEDFRRTSGIDMEFKIKGIPKKLFPSMEMALYKNTQEAITNAVRHGEARKIEVELEYGENEVKLTVKDNGIGCREVNKGMGISGMEERAALLGGKLSIASENGFVVVTIIPINNG